MDVSIVQRSRLSQNRFWANAYCYRGSNQARCCGRARASLGRRPWRSAAAWSLGPQLRPRHRRTWRGLAARLPFAGDHPAEPFRTGLALPPAQRMVPRSAYPLPAPPPPRASGIASRPPRPRQCYSSVPRRQQKLSGRGPARPGRWRLPHQPETPSGAGPPMTSSHPTPATCQWFSWHRSSPPSWPWRPNWPRWAPRSRDGLAERGLSR
jgi:hypothetical protein